MSALQFGPMRRLEPGKIRFLIVHTAGAPGGTDQSAEAIHLYHKRSPPHGRGWSGIGYHAVARFDGTLEEGRPEKFQGAHAEGMNHCSLGICATGNGDMFGFKEPQSDAIVKWLAERMRRYDIPLGHVIGHREVNMLPDVPRTSKSCPGTHVSMRKLRTRVLLELLDNDQPAPMITSYEPRSLRVPPASAMELTFV